MAKLMAAIPYLTIEFIGNRVDIEESRRITIGVFPEETMSFKIILVGDSGVGKTAFAERHYTGEFVKVHKPDSRVHMYPLSFNNRSIYIDLWVIPKSDVRHFHNVDGVIMMYDMCEPSTMWSLLSIHDKVLETSPDAKVIVVGNKLDEATDRGVKRARYFDPGVEHILYSVKSCHNWIKPLTSLIRRITGSKDLTLLLDDPML